MAAVISFFVTNIGIIAIICLWYQRDFCYTKLLSLMVSGHNATDKTPMYGMPLTFVFRFGVLGLGRAFFVLGFWVLASCHGRFVPRSILINLLTMVFKNLTFYNMKEKNCNMEESIRRGQKLIIHFTVCNVLLSVVLLCNERIFIPVQRATNILCELCVNVYYVNVCNMTSAFYKYPVFQELNGDVPDEREAAELKEQMWPKNTTNVKAMFEAKNEEDTTVKETPKQIDLQAEINGMCCITYVHVCHPILHVHVCHLVLYRFDKC